MTIAPETDIYVAQVAEDHKGLEGTSDKIMAKIVFLLAFCSTERQILSAN
jgi:hypothetical protein